jgi:protein-tyrosine phosphatase
MYKMTLMLYTQQDRNNDDLDGVWDAGSVVGYPWLFVGSLSAAESLKQLKKHKVTRVLTVARDLPELSWSNDTNNNIQHLIVEIDDHPSANILRVAETCWSFINDAARDYKNKNKNDKLVGPCILVHCASGVSRSVTAIVTWLIAHHNFSSKEALEAVKKHRSYARPNSGFKCQIDILQKHSGNISESIKEWDSINATGRIENATKLLLSANEIHADVDNLEVQIQSFISKWENEESRNKNRETKNNLPKETNCLLQEASRLCGLIDQYRGLNLDILLTQENVAKIVLKSARNKLEHLIKVIMNFSQKNIEK